MSENSKIEWTDHTFNPWIGCTKVSPGCANCYAETRDKRHLIEKVDHWGKGVPRLLTSDANWSEPVRWNNAARPGFHSWRKITDRTGIGDGWTHQCLHCGSVTDHPGTKAFKNDCKGTVKRPKVFCASQADWLDDEVEIEWLARLLKLIHQTPNLDWLLLTKRPQNWEPRLRMAAVHLQSQGFRHIEDKTWQLIDRWLPWNGRTDACQPPSNVWIGTTVEDQIRADERIPALLQIPARVRFLSCEPLLEEVDVSFGLPYALPDGVLPGENIDWVICGGESGPKARPMHPDWASNLRDQCESAGVPFLFKQWGEWAPAATHAFGDYPSAKEHVFHDSVIEGIPHGTSMLRVGKKAAGRLLDGIEHNAFPTS